jgi:hypothetical protein
MAKEVTRMGTRGEALRRTAEVGLERRCEGSDRSKGPRRRLLQKGRVETGGGETATAVK